MPAPISSLSLKYLMFSGVKLAMASRNMGIKEVFFVMPICANSGDDEDDRNGDDFAFNQKELRGNEDNGSSIDDSIKFGFSPN